MPRSKIFAMHARHASVQVVRMSQDVHALRQQAQQSRRMQGRIDALLASIGELKGPVSVAHLRDIGRLAERLGTEQKHQRSLEHQAKARAETLKIDLQGRLRQQRHAEKITAMMRRQEAEDRLRLHLAASPPAKNAR